MHLDITKYIYKKSMNYIMIKLLSNNKNIVLILSMAMWCVVSSCVSHNYSKRKSIESDFEGIWIRIRDDNKNELDNFKSQWFIRIKRKQGNSYFVEMKLGEYRYVPLFQRSGNFKLEQNYLVPEDDVRSHSLSLEEIDDIDSTLLYSPNMGYYRKVE